MIGTDLLIPLNNAPSRAVFIAAAVLQIHHIGPKGQDFMKNNRCGRLERVDLLKIVVEDLVYEVILIFFSPRDFMSIGQI